MFTTVQMRPLPHQSFVSAVTGFRLAWRHPVPLSIPIFHNETIRGKARLLGRIEFDHARRLAYPLLGLWDGSDRRALPSGTEILDESVPFQCMAKRRLGPSPWRADVSIRATTAFRTFLLRQLPSSAESFLIPPTRTGFIASENPLLIWVYGPPVPQ